MFFHRALLSGLLLVPAVLADRGPRSHLPFYDHKHGHRGRHHHHHHHYEHHEVHSPLDGNSTITPNGSVYTMNWAGAISAQDNNTFNFVTGTFTVPTPSGPNNSSAAIWVGIDGSTCESAILQAGVSFGLDENGTAYYIAWYEWLPDIMISFSNINITADDVVRLNVTATSLTSGFASVENLSTGQYNTTFVNSTYPLCEQDADWILEDYVEDTGLVPFTNFSAVNFVNAWATGPNLNGTRYYPSNGSLWYIVQNNQILTNVSINATDPSAFTITYV